MPATNTQAALDRLDTDGYVVLERAVGDDTLGRINDELAPYLGDDALHGRNDFEGFSTNRVYALLAKAPSIAELVEHVDIVAILDALLLPGYLLSANLAINLLPGETRQSLHFDDGFYRIPRPRPPVGVSTIWAIDDFTAENGSTEIIPGSHRWRSETPAEDDERIVRVEMPAGSVVVFLGTLWHRGGANRTDRSRLAITPQYCEPWARQQEQMVLSVGAAAGRFSDRVRSLLGYSIHPPFMGHVNGMHPLRLLDPAYDPASTGAGRAAADLLERASGPFVPDEDAQSRTSSEE
jgi:ectoine hydroxylase-related dioxygenase (phytanoyl-CoA dioxygenase family)